MYQNIGINLSKNINAATKRIKVPSITQRQYYKYPSNYEEELINYLESNINESINNDSDYSDECLNKCSLMNKMQNMNSKVIIMSGVGALIGLVGFYKLLKRK